MAVLVTSDLVQLSVVDCLSLVASDLNHPSVLVDSRRFSAGDRLPSLLRTAAVALEVSLLVAVVTSDVRLVTFPLRVEWWTCAASLLLSGVDVHGSGVRAVRRALVSFFLVIGFVRRRWRVCASGPLLTSFVLAVVDGDGEVHILVQRLLVSVFSDEFVLDVLL